MEEEREDTQNCYNVLFKVFSFQKGIMTHAKKQTNKQKYEPYTGRGGGAKLLVRVTRCQI